MIVEARYVVFFIYKNLIYQFKISYDIISENDTYFNNEKIYELCHKLCIKYHLLASYYIHENKQIKATNKILIKVLEKNVKIGIKNRDAFRSSPNQCHTYWVGIQYRDCDPFAHLKATIKFITIIDLPLNKYKKNRFT